jgi:hypothetical protein
MLSLPSLGLTMGNGQHFGRVCESRGSYKEDVDDGVRMHEYSLGTIFGLW